MFDYHETHYIEFTALFSMQLLLTNSCHDHPRYGDQKESIFYYAQARRRPKARVQMEDPFP